jgi:hypothetical protein
MENLSGSPKIVLLRSIFDPQNPKHGLFILKKFNNERHCTRQYVLNIFYTGGYCRHYLLSGTGNQACKSDGEKASLYTVRCSDFEFFSHFSRC